MAGLCTWVDYLPQARPTTHLLLAAASAPHTPAAWTEHLSPTAQTRISPTSLHLHRCAPNAPPG